ncbi:tRNA lysidine(34) synthetase TilS [Flavobacterium sp.]|uniref:tRNA lysidine(34) synthetase TilS n=1 Tax=Flavobacterium sp. TaxID=239 RepID=UPI0012047A8B|nr:tRNA lysidine(34) synthetase TilS [Flavobacterium sp.]RZJ72988.1 MAG: tRNA lysidine(34) synthetase TilS [Flavobacterium sp.]
MLSRFQLHVEKNLSFLKGKRLLLATSAGIDSMVMIDLFQKSGFGIGLVHCNFGLREDESERDEIFVREFAAANKLLSHVSKFDTNQFAKDFGLSIQVAARELRYKYFQEILESEKYDYVLTAHHADDNLETFLINLTRGTGIDGLTGIPQRNENVVRPLLPFSRDEIAAYAKSEQIEWREDSSNASEKYLRNKVRHQIVPILKEIRPEFLENFSKTQEFLLQTQTLADDASSIVFNKVAKTFGSETRFDLEQLKILPNFAAYLYEWLHDFGFANWSDIGDLVNAQSGKQIFSKTHVLLKDRGFLILSEVRSGHEKREFRIYKGMSGIEHPLKITIKSVEKAGQNSNTTIFVDAEKLQFPLVLRKWEQGDVFQPIGMDGSSKKIAKFFKDAKFSLRDKENAWLLVSGSDIVWIIGHRADERFKVNTHTTNILHFALN